MSSKRHEQQSTTYLICAYRLYTDIHTCINININMNIYLSADIHIPADTGKVRLASINICARRRNNANGFGFHKNTLFMEFTAEWAPLLAGLVY